MTTKTRISVTDLNAAEQALIDGIIEHQAALPASFIVAGVPVPSTSVVSMLKARIAARAAVASAKASYQAVVKASRDENAQSQPVVSNVREAIKLMFAGQIDVLADFGLKPRKARTPLSPEEKAASVAKGKATRKARHTMGPKAKARITGENPQGL
jgi:hypothetical protein